MDLAAEPFGQLAAHVVFEFCGVWESDDGDTDQRSAGRGIFGNDVADNAKIVDRSLTISVEHQDGIWQRRLGGIEVQAGCGAGSWGLPGVL